MASSPGLRRDHRRSHRQTSRSRCHFCTPMGKHVTHLLHVYIAEQLARHLNNRRVVVWYDPRSEFEPFVSELGGKPLGESLLQVIVGGLATTFAIHDGSLYS